MDWSLEAQVDVNKTLGGTAEAFRQTADDIFKERGYPVGLKNQRNLRSFVSR